MTDGAYEVVESVAGLPAVIAALDHPARLRILVMLSDGREYVSELARRLQISRPLLHMHLRRLEAARLVIGSLELSDDGKAMRFYADAPFDFHVTPYAITQAVSQLGPASLDTPNASKESD